MPHNHAATARAEAQARARRAAAAVKDGKATPAQARADAALWSAIVDWTAHPCVRGDGTLTAPACGWDALTSATDRAARAALKTYQDTGGDNAAPTNTTARAAGERWSALNALAHYAAGEALKSHTSNIGATKEKAA